MEFLPHAGDVLAAGDRFLILHARDLDQMVIDALLEASAKVSPVDKIVGFAEALYAARTELPADALVFAGQVIEFATRNGWHGLATDGRGAGMLAAVRRELGEEHPTGGAWPDPESDPAPAGAAGMVPVFPRGYQPGIPG